MAGREVKFINDFSGGLNSNSDPKDLDDNQQSVSNNIDYSTTGQLKLLGNPTSNTIYDSIEATIINGKGLFNYNSPYSSSIAGNSALTLTSLNTVVAYDGQKSIGYLAPANFNFHPMASTQPIWLNGFVRNDSSSSYYKDNSCTTLLTTGVLVNNGGGYAAGSTTITVDTVDATTKFSDGDVVLNSSGQEIGVISEVVSSTSLKINSENPTGSGWTTLNSNVGSDGIRVGLSDSEALFRSRSIVPTADATGATLIVPGQPVTCTTTAVLSDKTFVTKVQRTEFIVNGSFDDALATGTSNDQWADEDDDSDQNSTLTKDTSSKGYSGANSMKFVLNGATTGYATYRKASLVVGKEYTFSLRCAEGSSQTITSVQLGASEARDQTLTHAGETSGVIVGSGSVATYGHTYRAVTFKATATTMYLHVKVEGTDTHFLYIDKVSLKSRWFVDRFEINFPVLQAGTFTFRFDKVLFHDLLLSSGTGTVTTLGDYRNWLGLPTMTNLLNGDTDYPPADYNTMCTAIRDLCNGTDEVTTTTSTTNTTEGADAHTGDLSVPNYPIRGKAGDASSLITTSLGQGGVDFQHAVVGEVGNTTHIKFNTFVNCINYDGYSIENKGTYNANGTRPNGERNDYKDYGVAGPLVLQNDEFQKSIPSHWNGYSGYNGMYWEGNNSSAYQEQMLFSTVLGGGENALAQVTIIVLSGTPIEDDVIKLTFDGDTGSKQVTVTADSTPNLDELGAALVTAIDANSSIEALLGNGLGTGFVYDSGTNILTLTASSVGDSGSFNVEYQMIGGAVALKDDVFLAFMLSNGYLKYHSTETGWWDATIAATQVFGTTTDIDPVFYADGGKLRMCDGNFNNTNNVNKAFRYIKQIDLWPGAGGDNVDIEEWVLNNQEIKWQYGFNEGDGKGLRTRVDEALSTAPKEMDIFMEVISGVNAITQIIISGVLATVTTNPAHGLQTGDEVEISGSTAFDGKYEITVVTSTTFRFEVPEGMSNETGLTTVTWYKVGYWDETYKFFASAYDIDGNETLPELVFEHDGSSTTTLPLPGRILKFSVAADFGAVDAVANYIADFHTKGFRIYFAKSEDGYGEKWRLCDLDFKDGLIRTDNGNVIPWIQSSGDVVKITGDSITFSSPVEIETFETHNGYASTNTDLGARYKTACIIGRRLYVGNVFYSGVVYNDRMIVSPYNQLDVLPTPFGVIEVTMNDGQSIRVLKGLGDRLLQFKNQYLYIINVGSGEPSTFFLEATHKFYGAQTEHHVVEVPGGIIWGNENSLYMFNGDPENIIDLRTYAPSDKGGGAEETMYTRIKQSDWTDFFNPDSLIGYDPKSELVIIKRTATASSTSGDCFIYSLKTNAWTFAVGKWGNNVDSTNFITTINNELISILEIGPGASFSVGGDLPGKVDDEGGFITD